MTSRAEDTARDRPRPGGYGEGPPPPVLAGRVACLWRASAPAAEDGSAAEGRSAAGHAVRSDDGAGAGAGSMSDHAVLPDGAVDLVWHAERLTIAGPDTTARRVAAGAGTTVGVRLRPGAATTFGETAAALLDRQPSAEELWGADGRRLAERVADAAGARARLELLVAAVAGLVGDARPTDSLVDGAVAALRRGGPAVAPSCDADGNARASHGHGRGVGPGPPGSIAVAGLAADVGLSERQLRRRFHDHVGYGPKTLDRVLRLQRFLTLAIATDEPLSGLAVLAGYADQAHLTRETRALAGATPAELVAARRPGATTGPGFRGSRPTGVSETSKTAP